MVSTAFASPTYPFATRLTNGYKVLIDMRNMYFFMVN